MSEWGINESLCDLLLKMFRPYLSRAFFISLLGPILGNPMVLEVIVMVTPVISRSAGRRKP